MIIRRLAGLGTLLLLSACASKPLYYWGNYESVLYRSMTDAGRESPSRQIERLREDVAVAAKRGLALPPGFRAHLGYLYSEVGNGELARAEFLAEKQSFPEASALMDRFLAKGTPKRSDR